MRKIPSLPVVLVPSMVLAFAKVWLITSRAKTRRGSPILKILPALRDPLRG